jgi:CHAT domain-containing protein
MLDPRDIIIQPGGSGLDDNQLNPDGAIFLLDGGGSDFTISDRALTNLTGNIFLEARRDIIAQVGARVLNFTNQTLGETITFKADRDIQLNITTGAIATAGGSVDFSAGQNIAIIDASDMSNATEVINTQGGHINLTAGGDITVGSLLTSSAHNSGGNISLTSISGKITAEALLSSGGIIYQSGDANGGNITLNAAGNITIRTGVQSLSGGPTTEFARSLIAQPTDPAPADGNSNGGTISIISRNGAININGQSGVRSYSYPSSGLGTTALNASGGKVTLDAAGEITVGSVASFAGAGTGTVVTVDFASGDLPPSPVIGASNGGDITLISRNGVITINGGIDSSSDQASGGTVTLGAGGNITTSDIRSNGKQNGGEIALTSGGAIDTTTGILNAVGGNTGGNITLVAPGDINTGEITSFLSGFNGNSGSLSITSSNGNINTSKGALITVSGFGLGGDITLNSRAGSITTAQINAKSFSSIGGNIDLTARDNITITAGNNTTTSGDIKTIETNENSITFDGPVSLAGDVSFSTSGTGNITFNNTVDGTQNLALKTDTGNVLFNGVVGGSTPLNNLRVQGGITTTNPESVDITTVNKIETGNIISPGGIALTSNSGNIFTSVLDSSSFNKGGNVNLYAPGYITVSQINAQSFGTDMGGNVDIKTKSSVRASDSFLDRNNVNASISTAGGVDGGTIIIRHGGGGVIPFIVGNAAINGTEGAITRGNAAPEQTITPPQEYYPTHKQDVDRIQIISVPGDPPPPPPPPLVPPPPPLVPPPPPLVPPPPPLDKLAGLVGELIGAETQVNQDPQTGDYKFGWRISEDRLLSVNAPGTGPLINQPDDPIPSIDKLFEEQYEEYVGENITDRVVTTESLRDTLKTIKTQTGKSSAVVYVRQFPDRLELVLVLPESTPISKTVPQSNAVILQQTIKEFRRAVYDSTDSSGYKAPSQQLYQWLISPIESNLKALGIDTLIFCMDAGLRQIPLAALYDGKQFLVEKYSLGSIPSVSLTNTSYKAVKDSQVLGMGASKFQKLQPLPAVPVELAAITQQLWTGESFLNEQFTLNNLKAHSRRKPFGIIHLATHADFQAGDSSNSYIQLWDTQLRLAQLRQMGWNKLPQVELLVLSACRTAVGDVQAELGFGGLAVQAGVKSALASLWYVSDEGTLALMSEFYQHLSQPNVTIKAEALRQAQIAMLRGQVRLENGKLRGLDKLRQISLPPELASRGDRDLSHPFYWAAFTMIGSPW